MKDDGHWAGRPLSPEETKKLTPEWTKWESLTVSPEDSGPPQLLETYVAWAAA